MKNWVWATSLRLAPLPFLQMQDLITLRALRRCYAIDRNQITPSAVIEWTSVRATVMPIAGSELAVELEELDVVMKEIDAIREGVDEF